MYRRSRRSSENRDKRAQEDRGQGGPVTRCGGPGRRGNERTSGTAGAAEGAGYVGYGYTTSGGAVWCAQTLVNDVARKAGRAQIVEDGQWGPQTDAQIRWYQQWTGSKVDGIVGPETGNQLLFFGDKDYGGEYGHCYWCLPSDWRLGAMGVPTHLT